jgi:hypothetical protein
MFKLNITTQNVGNFINNIAKDIYPIDIPLTQGNPDPYLDNYLDLNIKIEQSFPF